MFIFVSKVKDVEKYIIGGRFNVACIIPKKWNQINMDPSNPFFNAIINFINDNCIRNKETINKILNLDYNNYDDYNTKFECLNNMSMIEMMNKYHGNIDTCTEGKKIISSFTIFKKRYNMDPDLYFEILGDYIYFKTTENTELRGDLKRYFGKKILADYRNQSELKKIVMVR